MNSWCAESGQRRTVEHDGRAARVTEGDGARVVDTAVTAYQLEEPQRLRRESFSERGLAKISSASVALGEGAAERIMCSRISVRFPSSRSPPISFP